MPEIFCVKTLRTSVLYSLVALALAAATTAICLVPGQGPAVAEEAKAVSTDPLWAASFKDLTGTLQPMSQYKGKVTVLYFWAAWCESCRIEAPQMSALQEKYKDKDLAVVGVAVDNADTVKAFVAKNKLTNPTVYGGKDAMGLMKALGNDKGAFPFAIVIDRDGKIVKTKLGDAPNDSIDGFVASLIG